MSSQEQEHPTAAPLVVRVGVTGHRLDGLKQDGFDENRLREAIRKVLEIIRETAEQITAESRDAYAESPPVLRIVSPLAEGADRLVAHEALGLGYHLQCPFPFSREEYEQDFKTAESREEFASLCEQASSVLELDGSRPKEKQAYEAVGRVVLQQSDILVAIWNGERPEGTEKQGGTGQIAMEGQALDLPVVRIDSKPPHPITILATRGNEEYADLSLLRRHLRRIFLPPAQEQLKAARRFWQEEQPRWNLGVFFKLFCKTWVWSTRWPKVRQRDFIEQALDDWQDTWKTLAEVDTAGGAGVADQIKKSYFAKFAWADGLAELCAGKYRSSFAATYLMGAWAILFAFIGSRTQEEHPLLSEFMVGIELLLIVLIIWITFRGRKHHWHERWMDYRSLAEGLRYMAFLSLLGQVTSSFQVPAHLEAGDPRRSWFNWYFRSTVRQAGLIRARADGSYLSASRQVLAQAIDSQVRYHAGASAQNHKLHHRLHKTATLLFILTAVACALHLLPLIDGVRKLLEDQGFLHGFEHLTTFCALVLPAFGGAISAISHQAEFDRISMRSHALSHHLEILSHQLYCLGERPSSQELGKIARSFTDLTLAELVDWRFAVLGKDLTLPA
ncbi:MAG TPA: DUF4231 domain-containing protein [Thermoanaerobaculia bacterium]|jgi:hypothetical protein|nr:DUF4231 domain-containing protein [Thermoanaerobaculia bacterium]